MKKIFLTLAAITLCQAVFAEESEPKDTLRSAVVTGTRVAMERDRVPAPVAIVGREAIEESDESALMPSVMEHVPGLFVTSRGVTGYGVSSGAAGAISLREIGRAHV